MSQKIFFQYLPVKGEIQAGDMYNAIEWIGKFEPLIARENDKTLDRDRYKKVRLFICSRDIKDGDRVRRLFKTGMCNPVKVLAVLETQLILDGGSFSPITDDKSLYFKTIDEVETDITSIPENVEFDSKILVDAKGGNVTITFPSLRKRELEFTKWITEEGEIKEGDHVLDPMIAPNDGLQYLYVDTFMNEFGDKVVLPEWRTRFHFKKAKLFLCSKDIQIGDLVFAMKGEEAGTVIDLDDLVYWQSKNAFKILHEISS